MEQSNNEVTEIVLRFRSILQDLWNNYCWRSPDLRDQDVMHEFRTLEVTLFQFFVLECVLPHPSPAQRLFGPGFYVVPPKRPDGARNWAMVLRIDVGQPGSSVWQEEVHEIDASDLTFELQDFFDWQLFYWRDYRYFEVKIQRWDRNPARLGFSALLDVLSVDVLFDAQRREFPAELAPLEYLTQTLFFIASTL